MYCDISIFQLDQRVRQCAVAVQDSFLLGKHVGGDMIAAEAKYHAARLLSLYRRAAQVSDRSRHLVWGATNRRRRRGRAPKARESRRQRRRVGVGCGDGVSPSPLEVGLGGIAPSPENFFNLLFKKACFGRF